MLNPDRLSQLREKAAQKRPPPIWVPTEPGEFVEGEIVASNRPLRGRDSYLPDATELTVKQPNGELITVQIYGRMSRDLSDADARLGALVHVEFLGKFPGVFGRGKYRRFATTVLTDEGHDDD